MKQGKKVNDTTKASIIHKKITHPEMSDRDIQKYFPEIKSNKTISTIVGKEFRDNNEKYQNIIDKNLQIIEKGQNIILSNIDTLDITSIKDLSTINNILYQAVRQNRMIEGYNDEKNDNSKYIPMNVSIQVINN